MNKRTELDRPTADGEASRCDKQSASMRSSERAALRAVTATAPFLAPLLVSSGEARRLLGIGKTKYFEILGAGGLDTVLLGRRRHVTYASILRLVQMTDLSS